MKVQLYMAMSLDGVIALPEGSEEFLSHQNWQTFCEAVAEHRCFVVGRKTFEAVSAWTGPYNFDSFHDVTKIVVSRKNTGMSKPGYNFVSSPEDALRVAQTRGHSSLVVTGGGELNNAFLQRDLVDNLVVNIEPVVVGAGIRLFGDTGTLVRLQFIDTKLLPEGILQVRYAVMRGEQEREAHRA